MDTTIAIIVFMVAIFLMLFFLYRSIEKQIKRVVTGERPLDDQAVWLRKFPAVPARVLSRIETIKPEAKGIARVDLDLEIQSPEAQPVKASTTWLVEIPSLPLLQVGNTVDVKFDPKNPGRVFPAVPWARLWMFGK